MYDADDLGAWSEFGTAAAMAGSRAAQDLTPEASTGFGDRPGPDLDGLGDAVRDTAEALRDLAPPEGYRNRVDADGDGSLDDATYRGRADGGADILVDVNGDGRVDFVGADVDLDNRVDFADYDADRDGVFEKRMYDDDGDGFLDRSVWTQGS